MLQANFQQVREAPDIDSYKAGLVAFANHLDFSSVSGILVVERLQQASQILAVSNTPDGFLSTYNDMGNAARDPVTQQLKKLNCPIIWDQSTFVEARAGDIWDKQAQFDYHTGIAMALHMPNGRHYYLGVDRRAPLPEDQTKLNRMLADLQLLAVYAQDSAQRLFAHAGSQQRPTLTRREIEVLQWTLLGKSAWVIAQILGLSENTTHWHAQRAMHKLGCDNKHSAALRARELGLL